MAIEKFGNTWWGQQWLLALDKIDHSNRIPRGMRYARNGSVLDIEFNKKGVGAKVSGSRPKPYKVKLSMGQISNSEMDQVIAKAKNYPTTIIKLLNGKMDPKLKEIMNNCGIQLFPSEAKDMKMECSCPDWAVPCKHIAAVLYIICREIDNDPFALFQFRGVDMISLLEKHNLRAEENTFEIITRKEYYATHPFLAKVEKVQLDINFSLLKDRLLEIAQLLPSNPVFYPSSDFKSKYINVLTRKAKIAKKLILGTVDICRVCDEQEMEALPYGAQIFLHESDCLLHIEGASISQLWQLDRDKIHLHHPSVNYTHALLQFAVQLIANGLIIPQLINDIDDVLDVIWTPCLLDKYVADSMVNLEGVQSLLVNEKQCTTKLALSFLITKLIHAISVTGDTGESFLDLFFTKYRVVYDDPFQASYPASIGRWLQLFDFDLGSYYPVLKVEEKGYKEFEVNIEVGSKDHPSDMPIPFAKFVESTGDNPALYDVYRDLELLTEYISQIDQYVNEFGKKPMMYDDETLVSFLFEVRPIMELLHIKVLMPKSLKKLIRPKATASVSSSVSEVSTGIISLGAMLDFDWKISVGKEFIDKNEFQKLLTSAGKLVKYKGSYIYMDQGQLSLLQKQVNAEPKLTNVDKLRIVLSEEYEGAPLDVTPEVKALIRELLDIDLVDTPLALKATLRPYQHRGYSWLVKNSMIGVGSIIADDMGLGKTLQVISWICRMIENKSLSDKKVLIIVPTSLVPNWESEFNKFTPSIVVYTHYGAQRKVENIANHAVVLTTYGTVRADAAKLKKLKWAATIIDEAQNIKNPTSQQTKAVKSIKADHHIAMSGTPVENGLMDYWSIMDYTNKGLLLNQSQFKKSFLNPISKNRDQDVISQFGKITAPFILRRMKTDKSIISDLPEKIIQDVYVPLSLEQGVLYQKTLDEAMLLIKESDNTESKSMFKRQGLILQMILALKQICNHPAQWLKNDRRDVELSGKLSQTVERLDTIFKVGDKVLIFTQFREMGDILEHTIKEQFDIDALWLHGGVSLKKRKEMVDQFQNQEHQKIMILSLKAGGTGLNLTAANHVIHYDLWWNPAVEAQATDRAYRIGQKKNVFVHRMITNNTFEEKINLLIQSKMELANLTVSSGESWIGKLSDQELEEVFG